MLLKKCLTLQRFLARATAQACDGKLRSASTSNFE